MTNVHQAQRKTSWSVDHDTPIDQFVDNRLRDYYELIIHEPVPDRFLDLLRRADRKRIALHLTSRKA
jgi:Anti-sigma factor NepR